MFTEVKVRGFTNDVEAVLRAEDETIRKVVALQPAMLDETGAGEPGHKSSITVNWESHNGYPEHNVDITVKTTFQ